jgi:hypothetical protein
MSVKRTGGRNEMNNFTFDYTYVDGLTPVVQAGSEEWAHLEAEGTDLDKVTCTCDLHVRVGEVGAVVLFELEDDIQEYLDNGTIVPVR